MPTIPLIEIQECSFSIMEGDTRGYTIDVVTDVNSMTPIDITDYTAFKMQARKQLGDNQAFDFTLANGFISIVDGTTNRLLIKGLHRLTWTGSSNGTYVYDLEAVDADGEVRSWMYGTITLKRQSTTI